MNGQVNQAAAMQTITVTDPVQNVNGATYTATAAPVSVVDATGNDIFNAASGALNSLDSLDGRLGNNLLSLTTAGGVSDLGAPWLLADIQTVTAIEGILGRGGDHADRRRRLPPHGGNQAGGQLRPDQLHQRQRWSRQHHLAFHT